MKITLKSVCALAATLLLLGALASTANASVTLTDEGGNNWRVQLDPITFSITSSASGTTRMLIEDFFATNATANGTHVSGSAFWSLNGAPALDITIESVSGVWNNTDNQHDPNDLLVNYAADYAPSGAGAVSNGDTVTLSADFIFNATAVPAVSSETSFTAHLLEGTSSFATTAIVVPEPSTYGLIAACLTLATVVATRRSGR